MSSKVTEVYNQMIDECMNELIDCKDLRNEKNYYSKKQYNPMVEVHFSIINTLFILLSQLKKEREDV